MHRKIAIFLTAALAAAACAAPAPPAPETPAPPVAPLRADIPDAPWVKIFFEGVDADDAERGIDRTAARDGFAKLRATRLPAGDLEIRVWAGFGKYGIDGFVLRRRANVWSAVALRRMLCHLEARGRYELAAPRAGWDALWEKLVAAGLLALPDPSRLNYNNGVIDGKSFVVETNYEQQYRTYHYGNPQAARIEQAAQMAAIARTIADEFGLPSFAPDGGGCGEQ